MRKFAFGKFSAVLFTAAMVLAFGVAAWAEYWNEGHSGDSWEDAYIIVYWSPYSGPPEVIRGRAKIERRRERKLQGVAEREWEIEETVIAQVQRQR